MFPWKWLRCVYLVAAIAASAAASGQEYRYWYDYSCRQRLDATVVATPADHAVLLPPGGSFRTVLAADMCQADQVYLQAFRLAEAAADHLQTTPYRMGKHELIRLRDQLVQTGVSSYHARRLTQSERHIGNRDLRQLRGQWIEIRGIAYRIVAAEPSTHVTGIDRLVVKVAPGRDVEVTEFDSQAIRILALRARPHTRWQAGPQPFKRRGPPSLSGYLARDKWQYTLVFDPVHQVWTDSESATAHGLLERVAGLWQLSDELAIVAEARWHVHQGDAASARGEFTVAVHHYSLAIAAVPNWAAVYLRRGLTYSQLSRDQDALADLDTAIDLEVVQRREGFTRVWVLLPAHEARARLRSQAKRHDGAIADAQRAVSLNPDAGDATYKDLLVQVRQIAADDATASARKVMADFRSGGNVEPAHFDAAVASAERAVQYNPDPANRVRYTVLLDECRKLSAQFLAHRAEEAFAHGEYAAAVSYAEQAVSRSADPKYQQTLQTYRLEHHEFLAAQTKAAAARAHAALAQQAWDDGIREAQRARILAPDELQADMKRLLAECLRQRATEAHYKEGEYRAAIADLTRSIELEPTEPTAYLFLGTAHANLGEVPEALTALNAAIRLDAQAEHAFVLRAAIHFRQGRLQDAVADFTKAIEINANEGLYWYLRGEAQLALGKVTEALSDAAQAITLDEREAKYHILRAQALQRSRRFGPALQSAAVARQLDPHSARALSAQQHHSAYTTILRPLLCGRGSADSSWGQAGPGLDWRPGSAWGSAKVQSEERFLG